MQKTMANKENRRSLFDLTFESGVEESDSDVDLGSSSDSSSESEEEEVFPQNQEDRWKFNNRPDIPKRPFCGPEPGPTVEFGQEAMEIDFFEAFFPTMLVEMMVVQTNLYASQKQRERPDPRWRPVTEAEVRAWLGIRVYMSILSLPQSAMYWSTDSMFGNLSVRNIMKRDRFDKITQYIHLNDRTGHPLRGQPGHDKLHHVRPFLDEVLSQCLSRYNPHQDLSIDEAMVKFRGRLSFRQYLPSKPTKYGIKVWVRADPTNGYVNEFQVYTGREGNTAEVGLATRVVEDLTAKIQDRCHIVNVDNFFTSPVLFQRLLEHGTYARGTARSNRKGFPLQQLKKSEVKESGQYNTCQKGELTAALWYDKKHVFCLSTAENPAGLASTVERQSRSGVVTTVRAPSIIPEYNNNMNGVDVADQLRTEYSTYRTSRKWWLYLFWFLFDTAVTNGFILMKESVNHQRVTKTGRGKPRTMIEFRMALAKQLIGEYTENERAVLTTLSAGHYPKMGEKRGRCRQCSKSKVRREVKNMCSQCNVHMCVDCFRAYHSDLLKNK